MAAHSRMSDLVFKDAEPFSRHVRSAAEPFQSLCKAIRDCVEAGGIHGASSAVVAQDAALALADLLSAMLAIQEQRLVDWKHRGEGRDQQCNPRIVKPAVRNREHKIAELASESHGRAADQVTTHEQL